MFNPPTSTVPTPEPPTIPTGDDQDTANKNTYSQNAASHTSTASLNDELQNVKGTDNPYKASGEHGATAGSEHGAVLEGNMTQVVKKLEGVAVTSQNAPSTGEDVPLTSENMLSEAGTTLGEELLLAQHRSDITPAELNQFVAAVYLADAVNPPSPRQAGNGSVSQHDGSATSAGIPVLPAQLPAIQQRTASNSPHYIDFPNATFNGPVNIFIHPAPPQSQSPQASGELTVSGHPEPPQSGAMTCPEYRSIASLPVSRTASLHKSLPDMVSAVSSQLAPHEGQTANLYQRESQITKNVSMNIVPSNGFRRRIVIFPTPHSSQEVETLFDSGSDINVMPLSLVKILGLCDCITRTHTLLCLSFSGHNIETVGSVTITWARTRHSKQYNTIFHVLPESNKAVDEMVLGAATITRYNLFKIRILGARKRKVLPNRPHDERTENNRIEHEKHKQNNKVLVAESRRKKEVAGAKEGSTGAA